MRGDVDPRVCIVQFRKVSEPCFFWYLRRLLLVPYISSIYFQKSLGSLREFSSLSKFFLQNECFLELHILLYCPSFSWYFSRVKLFFGSFPLCRPNFLTSCFKLLHSLSNHFFCYALYFFFFVDLYSFYLVSG